MWTTNVINLITQRINNRVSQFYYKIKNKYWATN